MAEWGRAFGQYCTNNPEEVEALLKWHHLHQRPVKSIYCWVRCFTRNYVPGIRQKYTYLSPTHWTEHRAFPLPWLPIYYYAVTCNKNTSNSPWKATWQPPTYYQWCVASWHNLLSQNVTLHSNLRQTVWCSKAKDTCDLVYGLSRLQIHVYILSAIRQAAILKHSKTIKHLIIKIII